MHLGDGDTELVRIGTEILPNLQKPIGDSTVLSIEFHNDFPCVMLKIDFLLAKDGRFLSEGYVIF